MSYVLGVLRYVLNCDRVVLHTLNLSVGVSYWMPDTYVGWHILPASLDGKEHAGPVRETQGMRCRLYDQRGELYD